MIDQKHTFFIQLSFFFGFLIVGFLLASFVFRYVEIEHPAYLWDWGGYFDFYRNLGAIAKNDFQSAFHSVLKSIRSDDYNISSISLLLPFYFLLGPERVAYISGIVVFFLIPAVFVTIYFCSIAYRDKISNISKYAALIFVIFFPPFWQAALRGLPDVVGLVPLGIASILLIKSEYFTRRFIAFSIAIGVLVWMAFMFRRWYAYAGISLLCCAFLMALWQNWIRNKSLRKLLIAVVPFFVLVLVGATLLATLQLELVSRIIHTSYVEIYKAYQAPISNQLIRYYSHSGPLFAILLTVGFLISLRNGYLDVLFFFSVGVLTMILFSTTQAPGVQHGLPIYFFLMPAVLVPIFKFFGNPSCFYHKAVFLVILIIVPVIYLTSFFPAVHRALPFIATIAPPLSYHPLHLANYSEYRRLIDDMHQMLDKKDRFAVFASNVFLADSLLRALDRTLEPHISWVSQVDQKDGFRISTLKARFAIIATPTPIHLPENSQRVIIVPSEMIKSGEGIGKDYRLVSGPYALDYGHNAFVYERLAPVTAGAIRDLEAAFKIFHKDWLWDGKDKISPP